MIKLWKLRINYKIVFLFIYLIVLVTLYKFNLIPNDLQSLKKVVLSNPDSILLTFMFLSIVRIFMGIPGSVFCVLGGLIFSPLQAALYSLIAYTTSLIIVFFIGRYLFADKLKSWLMKKNPNLHQLLSNNGTKVFTVGLLCPLAPGDLLCMMLSTLDISFFKYVTIVLITHVPWVLIYSFLGYSFHMPLPIIVLLLIGTLLITLYSIKSWNKVKAQKGYSKGL